MVKEKYVEEIKKISQTAQKNKT